MRASRRQVIAALAASAIPHGRARAQVSIGGGLVIDDARITQGGWARGRGPTGRPVTLDGKPIEIAADGRFLVAFDRDAPATAMLASGADVLPLAIAPRAWRIEQIDAPMRPQAMPDAEYLAIREGELARIAAARARVTGAQGWRQAFRWPAVGRLSGHFGAQRVYRGTPGSYHSGTDIAGGAGGAILAPADGVVILAAEQPFTLEGHLLMLDHGLGLNSAMLHCSELLVREGELVRQGQAIARIGMTGRATGPHLHWSLRWREARLDPELFVPATA